MDEYRIFPLLLIFMICTLTVLAYVLQRLGQREAHAECRTPGQYEQQHRFDDTDYLHGGTVLTPAEVGNAMGNRRENVHYEGQAS